MMKLNVELKNLLVIVGVEKKDTRFDLVFKKDTRELLAYINGELTKVHGKEFFNNRERLVNWPIVTATGFYLLGTILCNEDTVDMIDQVVKRASYAIGAKEDFHLVEMLLDTIKAQKGERPDDIHPHYATAIRDAVLLLAGVTANPYVPYVEEYEEEETLTVDDVFNDTNELGQYATNEVLYNLVKSYCKEEDKDRVFKELCYINLVSNGKVDAFLYEFDASLENRLNKEIERLNKYKCLVDSYLLNITAIRKAQLDIEQLHHKLNSYCVSI